MAGQRVGVQQEGVGVRATEAGTNIETAVTASDEKINKEYNTQILMAETPAEKKRLEAERDAKKARRAAEIRRSGVGAAPTSGGASKADNDPLGIRR